EQQHAAAIYKGSGPADSPAAANSIEAKAKSLGEVLQQLEAATKTAEENLNRAIQHFTEAAQSAETLNRDTRTRMNDPAVDPQTKAALKTLSSVFSPSIFRLGQADAT